MNCPNCGTYNKEGSKFCIKCGQSIFDIQSQDGAQNSNHQEIFEKSMGDVSVQNEGIFQANTNSIQNQNNSTNNVNSAVKISFMGYFSIILAVLLKPFTAFKEELNKFNVFKNSAILSLIVSVIATIISLITSMINAVRVKDYSWITGEYTVTWVWENLKELNYIQVIGKNLLIYLGVIFAIAAIYYIASLIVKKQTNFSRLLGISALIAIPMLICSLVLSPLLSMIYAELGMAVTIIGAVYTIILLYENMNNEILLEGNAKYYFNLVCLSIIAIAVYYLYMNLIISSVSDGLENVLDLFS